MKYASKRLCKCLGSASSQTEKRAEMQTRKRGRKITEM